MRKAVMLLGLVCVATLVVAVTWAAATPGLYVQVTPAEDANGNLTGNLDAHITTIGLTTAREVVFHMSFPTEYGVDMTASDITIVAVKPGADAMSIDTGSGNPTPVVFAEGNVSTTREVWVVALLNNNTNDPKSVCDVIFTCQGRPTTTPITIDNVQVKDGSLTVLASAGSFTSNASGTSPGVAVPLFGDFNWNGQIDLSDFGLFVKAWTANANGTYCPWADIGGGTFDSTTNLNTRTTTGNGANDLSDFSAFVKAWHNNATGSW